MKLIASLIVRNERGRYLSLVMRQLASFVDEVRVLDDGSTDGTLDWLTTTDHGVQVAVCADGPRFDENEGAARDCLFEWTLAGEPTHVISLDADELVTDPNLIRAAVATDAGPGVWSLEMCEVWHADANNVGIRRDGGWRPHHVPVLYRVPEGHLDARWWSIERVPLACGREPLAVRQNAHAAIQLPCAIFHLGWAQKSARRARYDRYMALDGGAYHNRQHLDSILDPDPPFDIRPWPAALQPFVGEVLGRSHA